MTRDDLIAFEEDIASEFNAGNIPYPVHLSSGNEDLLLDVFKDIREEDWVCGSWRSHLHCLLKGVPPEELKQAIMDGRSIALSFPEYRVLCSAIVAGIAPIAMGIAMGIKCSGGTEVVHCFLGDMSAETGIAHECRKYARNHDLPIHWIVEDNETSVCTPTAETWGCRGDWAHEPNVTHYRYSSHWPHAGAGQRVEF